MSLQVSSEKESFIVTALLAIDAIVAIGPAPVLDEKKLDTLKGKAAVQFYTEHELALAEWESKRAAAIESAWQAHTTNVALLDGQAAAKRAAAKAAKSENADSGNSGSLSFGSWRNPAGTVVLDWHAADSWVLTVDGQEYRAADYGKLTGFVRACDLATAIRKANGNKEIALARMATGKRGSFWKWAPVTAK